MAGVSLFGMAASDASMPARRESPPVSSGQFSPSWFTERAKMLQRICTRIEARRDRGQSVREATTYFSWYWSGRNYRSAPRVKVRLSRMTLTTLYYRWRRSGRQRECFALRYTVKRTAISPALVGRFVDECAAPGVCSMTEAWQRLAPAGVSMRLLAGLLPAETRLAIRKAHQAKRNLRAQEAAIARFGAYQI
jgi:hypothetical protein